MTDLVSAISSLNATNGINLGGFSFSLPTEGAVTRSGISLQDQQHRRADPTSPINQATGVEKQFFTGGPNDNAGLTFPLLENPKSVFRLLLGKDVDLVEFDMPRLNVEFSYNQFFPTSARSGAQFTGRSGHREVQIGLDTYGFTHGGDLLGRVLHRTTATPAATTCRRWSSTRQ